MDKIRDLPASVDTDLRVAVVAGRPVTMPKEHAHLYDRGADGDPVFRWTRGPTVLTEWLKRRKE